MATHETLTGIYDRPVWVSDANDYVIARLKDGTTVKGPAESGELVGGTAYKFFGKWTEGNGKFGPAFQFIVASPDKPHGREAVVAYLLRLFRGHSTGIGESKANALYDLYESDAVRRLRMEPAECAAAINLDVAKARAAALILDQNDQYEDAKIELIGLFAGKGFPNSTIKECIDKWKAKAPAQIRRDAFLLMTNKIAGAGFSRCDNLYLSLGGNPGRLKRQALCAWYGIHSDGAGHTWHRPETAARKVKELIAGADPKPTVAIKLARRAGWLTKRAADDGSGAAPSVWIADAKRAANEADVARIVAMADMPGGWPDVTHGELTAHQREKLAAATTGRIGILAGTPGTGKTFAAAALIQAIVAQYGEGAIEICAPTGKAAVRITEAMGRYRLKLKGKTIHRMLRPDRNGHGTGDWGFSHNEDCPIEAPFVVVDESSMIDTDLMAALLRAIDPVSGRILLIGDPYQLPPVGHGAPLRDLIAAGIPCGELSEVKRNDGLIVRACAAIKDGQPWKACERFDDVLGNNLRIVDVATSVGVVHQLTEMYKAIIQAGRRDPFEDVQVLVALNEKSEIGRRKLNLILQELVNPIGYRADSNRYRQGDKVICLSNGGYPVNPSGTTYVANGEMGRVLEVETTYSLFEFSDCGDGCSRVLRIPTKGELADSFDLAYAITCHKSQGSEWPVVIILADDAADRVACREWHYTGISRGAERCIILGKKSTVARQCRRVTLRDRKTFLVELIRKQQSARIMEGADDVGERERADCTVSV